jgi:periplasmic protein TonB
MIVVVFIACTTSSKQIASAPAATPDAAPMHATESESPPAYFEFQVEKPAGPMLGNKGPIYPRELRDAGTQGEVLAQFVIDTLGRAEMPTFKILRSSHGAFSESVKEAVAAMRFTPAELHGRKVRMLAQQPFNFFLAK